jgi:hypothetical protein
MGRKWDDTVVLYLWIVIGSQCAIALDGARSSQWIHGRYLTLSYGQNKEAATRKPPCGARVIFSSNLNLQLVTYTL